MVGEDVALSYCVSPPTDVGVALRGGCASVSTIPFRATAADGPGIGAGVKFVTNGGGGGRVGDPGNGGLVRGETESGTIDD